MDKPDVIYLQWDDGSYPIAWCVNKINETDIKYICAEKAEAENAALRKLVAELEVEIERLRPRWEGIPER